MMELSGALNKDFPVPDYLEATIYSKDMAVIMVGNFAEVDTWDKWLQVGHFLSLCHCLIRLFQVNDVCRWWKPWFYKHVETKWPRGGIEYIPLESYLLRHNRAIFWVLESMIPFGNHPVFRYH